MNKNREPSLFKAKLLVDCFGNSAGEILKIKAYDRTTGDLYYYDGFNRWSVLLKKDEHIEWERINDKSAELADVYDILFKLYAPARIAVNQLICLGGDEICQPCENREKLALALKTAEEILIKRGYINAKN